MRPAEDDTVGARQVGPISPDGTAAGATDKDQHALFRAGDDYDDWAWRHKIRQNPATRKLYRTVVLLVGTLIVIAGLGMVPLPGPGWLVVIFGLIILASEFEWAHTVLSFVKDKVRAWERWIKARPWYVQGLAGALTFVLVLGLLWLSLRLSGVPSFLPDAIKTWLHAKAAL